MFENILKFGAQAKIADRHKMENGKDIFIAFPLDQAIHSPMIYLKLQMIVKGKFRFSISFS